MLIHRMLPVLFCAVPLAPQNFIQMSDPQFGMFTKAAHTWLAAKNVRVGDDETVSHIVECRAIFSAGAVTACGTFAVGSWQGLAIVPD